HEYGVAFAAGLRSRFGDENEYGTGMPGLQAPVSRARGGCAVERSLGAGSEASSGPVGPIRLPRREGRPELVHAPERPPCREVRPRARARARPGKVALPRRLPRARARARPGKVALPRRLPRARARARARPGKVALPRRL